MEIGFLPRGPLGFRKLIPINPIPTPADPSQAVFPRVASTLNGHRWFPTSGPPPITRLNSAVLNWSPNGKGTYPNFYRPPKGSPRGGRSGGGPRGPPLTNGAGAVPTKTPPLIFGPPNPLPRTVTPSGTGSLGFFRRHSPTDCLPGSPNLSPLSEIGSKARSPCPSQRRNASLPKCLVRNRRQTALTTA